MIRALLVASLVFPSTASAGLFKCVVVESIPHKELVNKLTIAGTGSGKLTILSNTGSSAVYTCADVDELYSCSAEHEDAVFDANNGLLREYAKDSSWLVTHRCERFR